MTSVTPRLLTVPEAAACLGVSERMMERLLRKGEMPVVRIGAAVRVPVTDLDAWVEGHREDWATAEPWPVSRTA